MSDVIKNIGETEGSKQLAIHVSHEDPDAIIASGSYDGQLIGASIIFTDSNAMLTDAELAQVYISFAKCRPDSVDVQHIGIVHETEEENETD